MSNNQIRLKITEFIISLQLETAGFVSGFLEATLRGGFGYTLRNLVCVTKKKSCAGCMLKHSCAYAYIFETPPPAGASRMRKYRAVPHPFTMRVQQDGEQLLIKLALFGETHTYMPYFIYTLNKLGTCGLGKKRIPFKVKNVLHAGKPVYVGDMQIDEQCIQPEILTVRPGMENEKELTLNFSTPLTLRKDGKIVHLFEPNTFITTLLRRVTNVNAFYGSIPDQCIDPRVYLDAQRRIHACSKMRYIQRNRYSTRQKKRIVYDGLVGTVCLSGAGVGVLEPLLEAGCRLGVGKNTAFGAGFYKIVPADEKTDSVKDRQRQGAEV